MSNRLGTSVGAKALAVAAKIEKSAKDARLHLSEFSRELDANNPQHKPALDSISMASNELARIGVALRMFRAVVRTADMMAKRVP